MAPQQSAVKFLDGEHVESVVHDLFHTHTTRMWQGPSCAGWHGMSLDSCGSGLDTVNGGTDRIEAAG